MSFGNDVYRVTFETEGKEDLPLFGGRFNFQLDGVVDCQEFLVYFPVLEMMAEKYGMKLVMKMPFAEFYKEAVKDTKNRRLLSKMDALEKYPADKTSSLFGSPDTDYEHAKKFLEQFKTKLNDRLDKNDKETSLSVGTLSKSEWEAITVYCVFMFQKVRDPVTGEIWEGHSVEEGTSLGNPIHENGNLDESIPLRLFQTDLPNRES